MTSKDTEWSQYSHGNPRGWRRVYRSQLLYAFHDTFTYVRPDRGKGRVVRRCQAASRSVLRGGDWNMTDEEERARRLADLEELRQLIIGHDRDSRLLGNMRAETMWEAIGYVQQELARVDPIDWEAEAMQSLEGIKDRDVALDALRFECADAFEAGRKEGVREEQQRQLDVSFLTRRTSANVAPPRISTREAARRHMPLDGADAQAMEHVITVVERELSALRLDHELLKAEHASCGTLEFELKVARKELEEADAAGAARMKAAVLAELREESVEVHERVDGEKADLMVWMLKRLHSRIKADDFGKALKG